MSQLLDGVGERIIQHHSKSFALASRLLPARARKDAVAVYAWCRRADDAIDLTTPDRQPATLRELRAELDSVYSGASLSDPVLQIFQRAVRGRRIPREYAEDLLTGMQMDVEGRDYPDLPSLLEYCYYVAGCVGLMMCHVMGLRDDRALVNASHLGIGMQITNICRDVEEDWGRDRLYLPAELLASHGAPDLAGRLGGPFPEEARKPSAGAIRELLRVADEYYRSGDRGIPALGWHESLAIRTARSVYSAIGGKIANQGFDPVAGRAFVSRGEKLRLAAVAMGAGISDGVGRMVSRAAATRPPGIVLRFPEGVLTPDARPLPGLEAKS